jgi:predicted porin
LQTRKRTHTRLKHRRKARGAFKRAVDAKRKHKNKNAITMKNIQKDTSDARERTSRHTMWRKGFRMQYLECMLATTYLQTRKETRKKTKKSQGPLRETIVK